MSSYLAHICNLLPDLPRLFNKQFFRAAFFFCINIFVPNGKIFTHLYVKLHWYLDANPVTDSLHIILNNGQYDAVSFCYSVHHILTLHRCNQTATATVAAIFSVSLALGLVHLCCHQCVAEWLGKICRSLSVFIELKSFTSVCPSRSFKHVRVTCKIPFDCLLFNRFGVSTGRKKGAFFRLGINKCIY